jgi:hypothetical protein
MSTSPRPPDRESWFIISITAHRKLADAHVSTIHATMQKIVRSPDVDAVYFGGALGGDTEALKAALYFRQGKRPWLVVVVPDTVAKQPIDTRAWTRQADEVIELRNPIRREDDFVSYTVRDRYLVDVASTVVAFFSGNYRSGTGQTVRMAEKDGLVVTKVMLSG